jgi:hydroxyacylglutathione hydrolase
MSSERSSTIGKQRTENFAPQTRSRDEFVRLLTAELPERPRLLFESIPRSTGPAPRRWPICPTPTVYRRKIGLNRPIILVAEDRDTMLEARVRVARVGMEQVIGYLEEGMTAWFREDLSVATIPQITVQDLNRELTTDPGHIQLIDVRQPAEFEQGHSPRAVSKPLLDDLERSRPVAVNCKSGYRSSIATSLLERAGFGGVMNAIGGFDAWKACGLPG